MDQSSGTLLAKGIGIIGLGRVGTVLALQCLRQRIPLTALFDTDSSALQRIQALTGTHFSTEMNSFQRCGLVMICVPESTIEAVARNALESKWLAAGSLLAHTSAVYEWESPFVAGYPAINFGSFHPLMAFPSNPLHACSFKDIGAGIRGSAECVAELFELARRLGAIPFILPADHRITYHTAAVFASNFPVFLQHIAQQLVASIGLSPSQSRTLLLGLLDSARRNLSMEAPLDALSGPAARKDLVTLQAHLDNLEKNFPEYGGVYRVLSDAIISAIDSRKMKD